MSILNNRPQCVLLKFAKEDIVDLLHPDMDGESAPTIARAWVNNLPECNDKLHGKEILENIAIVETRQVCDEHSMVEFVLAR